MIDLDGHKATEFDGNSKAEIAATAARAAVASAKKQRDLAAGAYARALAAAAAAKGQINSTCPMNPCSVANRKEWKQSKLDAYEAAQSLVRQAKARLDAANSAVAAAERALRNVQAEATAKPKPKPIRESNSEGARAGLAKALPKPKDEGIGGFLHGALDVIGMVPILGEPADLLNAGVYAAEGDFLNAGLSAASAIPLAGNVIGAGKLALKYGDDVAGFAISHVDEAASGLSRNADDAVSCAIKGKSFSPSTAVATPNGATAISELEVGDKVTAIDADTREVDEHTVTAVMANDDPSIEYLWIDGEMIETTPDHPFLTDRGWAEAEGLWPGDQVLKLDGTYGTVDGYRIEFRPVVMWDLTVSEVHTYAVGQGKWVVHNCGPSSAILRENLENAGSHAGAEDAAHHIVAGRDKRAAGSRGILSQHGIDINDATNGVFLPRNLNDPNPLGTAVHSTTHPSSYHAAVATLLRGASSRADVDAALSYVRDRLLGGGFP